MIRIITINPVTSTLTYAVGTTIAPISLVANGGLSPYQYTITAGTLPFGLNLISGVITGTASTSGTNSITVSTTDANNCVGTTVYTFVIGAVGCPTVTFGITSASAGTVNTPYSLNAAANTAVSYSVFPNLPAGITINSATGFN